ncbi:hypothetical protein AAY473_001242 [Plecturocebus cupreus]
MGFCHVGQAGFKLLTSGDPPVLATQSGGITELRFSSSALYRVTHVELEATQLLWSRPEKAAQEQGDI